MPGPRNASINGDGFRYYVWTDAVTGETTDVLSVTSIRKLCGESFTLVAWQINNVIDVVMSTIKRPAIGKRGGILKGKFTNAVDEYPGEFARRYAASDGEQGKLDELRKWVRDSADAPRNIAAVRGSITHEAIEKNVAFDRIERPYVESAFANLSHRDQSRVKDGVSDEDVQFVRDSMRHYWSMREGFPFIIIAREVQCFNITAGYGGTFDALAWVLPDNIDRLQLPRARDITLATIAAFGGYLMLLDWKTSKGVYTDHVTQLHAYLAAEFVGSDGVIDRRLTDLLLATHKGGLVHIRPTGWGVHTFTFQEEVVRGFLGSVAFARLLAAHPKPDSLFDDNITGGAPDEEDDE